MLILLKKKYDTSNKEDYKKLLQHLKQLPENELKEAHKKIKSLIEKAFLVSRRDLDLYQLCSVKDKLKVEPFPTEYIQYTDKELKNRKYTFLNGTFYILPQTDDAKDTVYALIDKFIYESMRHEDNEEPCKSLRAAIYKLMPNSKNYKISDFERVLAERETSAKTYFSEYLSDDSDSEEEKKYIKTSKKEQATKTNEATIYCKGAQYSKFFKAFKNQKTVSDNALLSRPDIKRLEGFNRRQVTIDLKTINVHLKEGGQLTQEFLNTVQTQFVVAQYRGIHYVTSRWDAAARRQHRDLDEVGKPQYTSAVFRAEGIVDYHDMLDKTLSEPEVNQQLAQAALVIENILIKMQQSDPCSFEGYAYENLFLLLQKQYSANYDGFPGWLDKELKKKNSILRGFLHTSERPLLSTSDVPNHALKYAFGVKLYKNHKEERLRPRWRSNLKAERPYSGKVYLSLHPLTDYEEHKPSHLTSLFKQGRVNLSNFIVAERETSFMGYMPAERVVYHFKAKYPSFQGEYKTIFHHKYGIDESMYQALQQAFAEYAPHSIERKNVIKSLGDYLCAYNEVRLVAKAERLARTNNQVLIYRDENGFFSLNLPKTPSTASKRLGGIIEAERALYKTIASGKGSELKLIKREQFNQESEKLRFVLRHFKILLNNGYSLSDFKPIPMDKLELINDVLLLDLIADEEISLGELIDLDKKHLAIICQNPIISTIADDANNFDKICAFSEHKMNLLANENLLQLLEFNLITIDEIRDSNTRDLARLLEFDNLDKPLSEYYSLKELLKLLNVNENHIHCLTTDDLAELVLIEAPHVPELILKYAQEEDIDFNEISEQLCRLDRILFKQCLENCFTESEDESYSMN